MHKRIYLFLMFLALSALGMGQAVGLILNAPSKETSDETTSAPLIFTGEVILESTPVYAPEEGLWTQIAPEGKVTPGQVLFTGPVSPGDAGEGLRLQTGALDAAKMALPRRREALHRAIASLSAGEGSVVDAMALVMETPTEASLQQTRQRLALWADQCQEITAGVGGIFVPAAEEDALGYIITDRRWQLALELPFPVSEGDIISARLLSGIFREVEFSVEQVECVESAWRVMLSCEEDVASVGKIRNLTVKILSES